MLSLSIYMCICICICIYIYIYIHTHVMSFGPPEPSRHCKASLGMAGMPLITEGSKHDYV